MDCRSAVSWRSPSNKILLKFKAIEAIAVFPWQLSYFLENLARRLAYQSPANCMHF
ncbi:hypothetical protein ABN584_21785 [Gloeocapsa sp. BRSZ]